MREIKPKFFASTDAGKNVDLPYYYETIQQAATWLNNNPRVVAIKERFWVYDSNHKDVCKIYDITLICIDVLSQRELH